MNFKDLMKANTEMFESWKSDKDFGYSLEYLQKEYLKCIQDAINSEFVILTDEELNTKMQGYYNSMEGLY